MKNVQISFDENLLNAVDRFAASSRLSRSAIIRQALKNWLRQKKIKEFEEQWIKSLEMNPDDSKKGEVWIQVQQWDD